MGRVRTNSGGLIPQPRDVITHVEGVAVGNDGTVSLKGSKEQEHLRLSFEYFGFCSSCSLTTFNWLTSTTTSLVSNIP